MSDLGTDSGQSALSLTAKVVEALFKLIDKIFELNSPERKMAKLKLEDVKDEAERRKLFEELQYKCGYVNYQDLKRSGMELAPVGIPMTKAEMKDFAALCKREGVLFSGMTEKDRLDVNGDGVKTYEIICPKKDLEKIKDIVDRMNVEKMINGIDERIAELESKGESMTAQDKVDVTALRAQKEALQRGYCEKFNDEMSRNVIDRTVKGEVEQTLTLDEALNRLTGRHIDKDVVCIVADANDPSKYIKCHGYQDTYNEQDYIKTDYEVYRDGKCVLKTHDGRFDGRPDGYWEDQKDAIQKAGEFSGTFFKFYSVAEYQKWVENVKEQNQEELTSMIKDGDKSLPVIIKQLEMKLDENGAALKDGKIVDKETGQELTAMVMEGMTEEEKALVAESLVIGKQIDNYTEMSRLKDELTVARATVLACEPGTEEVLEASVEMENIQNKYNYTLDVEKVLIDERKDINAVQAEQEVRSFVEQQIDRPVDENFYEMFMEIMDEGYDNRQMNMDEVKAEIAKERANQADKASTVEKGQQLNVPTKSTDTLER